MKEFHRNSALLRQQMNDTLDLLREYDASTNSTPKLKKNGYHINSDQDKENTVPNKGSATPPVYRISVEKKLKLALTPASSSVPKSSIGISPQETGRKRAHSGSIINRRKERNGSVLENLSAQPPFCKSKLTMSPKVCNDLIDESNIKFSEESYSDPDLDKLTAIPIRKSKKLRRSISSPESLRKISAHRISHFARITSDSKVPQKSKSTSFVSTVPTSDRIINNSTSKKTAVEIYSNTDKVDNSTDMGIEFPVRCLKVSDSTLPKTISTQMQVGVSKTQGTRQYMEDRYTIAIKLFDDIDSNKLKKGSNPSVVGVFDGHNGAMAAEYSTNRFCELLHSNAYLLELALKLDADSRTLLSEEIAAVMEIMREIFAMVDKEIIELTVSQNRKDGSTAILGLLLAGKLFVANLGDSRAVYGRAKDGIVERLSVDHKPDLAKEMQRVEKSGGKVIHSGCWRVAHDEIPLRLAVSRALGDHPLKINLPESCSGPLLSVVPDIQVLDVISLDRSAVDESDVEDDNIDTYQYVIMGTDGLWDRVNDREAMEIVHGAVLKQVQHSIDNNEALTITQSVIHRAADLLVETALRRKSRDNITAIVLAWAS